MQPPREDVAGSDIVVSGHNEVRKQRLRGRLSRKGGKLRDDAVRAEGQHLRCKFLHLWCKMLSSGQIRGARAILRLGQAELAEAADISLETVKRIESMEGELKIRLDTLAKIKTALEKAGIEFIAENGGGAGVRLRKVQR